MKLNKYTKTAIVFTIGASVFVTTAFADMLLGSGYDKLKQAIKTTTHNMGNEFSSYTAVSNIEIKYDDKGVYTTNDVQMVDVKNKQEMNISQTTDYTNESFSHYNESYRDTLYSIYKYDGEQYRGYKYSSERLDFVPGSNFNDVFTDEYAPEIEKVIDAAVGNMKNLVQYESQANDIFAYSGELNSSQVPALYNALISLALKDFVDFDLPETENPNEIHDAYVSYVSGEAVQHADGYLTKLSGLVNLSFNDENKKQHTLSIKLNVELKDINNTIITKPTIDDSKLEEQEVYKYQILPAKYVGTFTNPIISETKDEFVKIGERTIIITEITNDKIIGSYEEVYYPSELTEGMQGFKAEFEDIFDNSYIGYFNPIDNTKYYANIGQYGMGEIYFEYGIQIDEDGFMSYIGSPHNFNNMFSKVFE